MMVLFMMFLHARRSMAGVISSIFGAKPANPNFAGRGSPRLRIDYSFIFKANIAVFFYGICSRGTTEERVNPESISTLIDIT